MKAWEDVFEMDGDKLDMVAGDGVTDFEMDIVSVVVSLFDMEYDKEFE